MADELGMLVLTMRPNERVVLRDNAGRLLASMTVDRNSRYGNIRLVIVAPHEVDIGREDKATDLRAVVSGERVRNSYKNGGGP
jgi:hypothetical protein